MSAAKSKQKRVNRSDPSQVLGSLISVRAVVGGCVRMLATRTKVRDEDNESNNDNKCPVIAN